MNLIVKKGFSHTVQASPVFRFTIHNKYNIVVKRLHRERTCPVDITNRREGRPIGDRRIENTQREYSFSHTRNGEIKEECVTENEIERIHM